MLGWLLALLIALMGLFYLLAGSSAGGGSDIGGGEITYIIGAGALALLYISALAGDYRGRMSQGVRHAAIWLALGLVIIAVYSYRTEVSQVYQRIAGEMVPAGQGLEVESTEPGERAVRLRRRTDGHFFARGEVNGQAMSLLVDTGASTVVLKPADAERAGIDISRLSFTVAVSTANGEAFAAPVRLRSIAIGPLEVRDVEALVARPGSLNESLLGMSFLKRLRSYEFSGDFLTLRG